MRQISINLYYLIRISINIRSDDVNLFAEGYFHSLLHFIRYIYISKRLFNSQPRTICNISNKHIPLLSKVASKKATNPTKIMRPLCLLCGLSS